MRQLNQDQKVNNAEVLLPAEKQEEGMTMPYVPNSPMDLPVDRFTRALARREENRRALLSWIRNNLTQGIDFGRIHGVGKNKCRYAQEGRAHECDNPHHWSKPSLWKPGAERFAVCSDLSPAFPT